MAWVFPWAGNRKGESLDNQRTDVDLLAEVSDQLVTTGLKALAVKTDQDLSVTGQSGFEFERFEPGPRMVVVHDFGGSVSGFFAVCVDEEMIGRCVGLSHLPAEGGRELVRARYGSLLMELLSEVSRDCLLGIETSYPMLTLQAPRIIYGEVCYPNSTCYMQSVLTPMGRIYFAASLDPSTVKVRRHEDALERGDAELVSDLMAEMKCLSAKLEQSERSLAESRKELGHLREQGRMAERAKSVFLASMSHELRTPLTAILGFAEILSGTLVEAEHLEPLYTIRNNARQLLRSIEGVLDLSQIESGEMLITKTRCTPADIVTEAIACMAPRARAKGLSLVHDFRGRTPETVHSDRERVKQILLNLVGNAIKFTEAGSVRVVVEAYEDVAKRGAFLAFEVIDSGAGVDMERTTQMFRPFTRFDSSAQGDSPKTRQYAGTGLGLAISKRLAKLLGGELTVSSRREEGSCFRFTICTGSLMGVAMIDDPVQAWQRKLERKKVYQESVPPAANPLEARRILLAEDGPDNQKLISCILRKYGASVQVVENGAYAKDAARDADETGHPFDVILMDMQMPVLDGYAATQELRAMGYKGPILAVTANAMRGDKERCLEAGCNGYLSKPLKRQDLLDSILVVMDGQADMQTDVQLSMQAPRP